MKRKKYTQPRICVAQMEPTAILAGSYIEKASDNDYKEENISSLRDADGNIFAD